MHKCHPQLQLTVVWIAKNMISKTIVDLLAEEDMDLLTDNGKPRRIDDTFISREAKSPEKSHPSSDPRLSTRKKLNILDWFAIDRQLRSYGSSKIGDLTLTLIDKDAREYFSAGGLESAFDFGSDSIPFAVKYNVAVALSQSEAIDILSHLSNCELYTSAEVESIFRKHGMRVQPGLNSVDFDELPLDMKKRFTSLKIFL